jgi:hypothetical protein
VDRVLAYDDDGFELGGRRNWCGVLPVSELSKCCCIGDLQQLRIVLIRGIKTSQEEGESEVMGGDEPFDEVDMRILFRLMLSASFITLTVLAYWKSW